MVKPCQWQEYTHCSCGTIPDASADIGVKGVIGPMDPSPIDGGPIDGGPTDPGGPIGVPGGTDGLFG